MLYRFLIENFKSFQNLNEISLIPSEKNHADVAYGNTSWPVLKRAVMYGANAAGKSNLIKGISFMRNIVLDNSVLSHSRNLAFKLSKESIENPTLFCVEIRHENGIYQYAIALSFKEAIIIGERLQWTSNESHGQWECLFDRHYQNNKQQIDFSIEEPEKNRYEVYRQDFEHCTDKLFLTEIASKNIHTGSFAMHINNVYEWFKDLIVLFPDSTYNLLGAIVKDKKAVNALYKKYFKIFNIDIKEIKLVAIPKDSVHLPDEVIADIKKDLKKSKKEKFAILHRNNFDMLASMSPEGDIQISEVHFIHEKDGFEQAFGAREESDGTRRLFDLIPMLGYLIDTNCVAVIDEIERSLHCLLTREMLNYVRKNAKDKKSQMIITTHDVMLMDSNILSKDEIWFVDKINKSSKLHPLSQYKLDELMEKNIGANYLLGRFDGKPNFEYI